MIAARIHGFGKSDDVLSLDHIDLPDPAPDEIQLEMLATPINPADLNIIEGTYGMLPELPAIIGNEGVGRVAAVGSEITALRPGDLAAPLDPGSWCERRNVRANRLVPLPTGVDPRQAAMITVNPPTAYALLHDFVSLVPGDWVVQNAANSGVGRCVIQLASRLGLRTLNVVRRPELIEELTALGADLVVTEDIDLRREGAKLMGGSGARLGLNAVGGASALNLANVLVNEGSLITYGAMARQPLKIPNGLLIFREVVFRGFWLRRWFQAKPAAEQHRIFGLLAEMIRAGTIKMPIHRVFPLGEIRAALHEAASPSRAGKVMLDPGIT